MPLHRTRNTTNEHGKYYSSEAYSEHGRQKHPPTKVDKTEISPIDVEEYSSSRPPNSPRTGSSPLVSPLDHQTNSCEACIDSFLAQFEDDQQFTSFDDYLYEKPYASLVVAAKNPPLCYDKIIEESLEKEDLLKRLKKKNKQLKKEVKEYQVLTHVIQQEYNRCKA